MLPGFDDAKTAALARACDAMACAVVRVRGVRAALDDLETVATVPAEVMQAIEAVELSAAILGLDPDSRAAVLLAVGVIEQMEAAGPDETASAFRSISNRDLQALELIKQIRAAGRLPS